LAFRDLRGGQDEKSAPRMTKVSGHERPPGEARRRDRRYHRPSNLPRRVPFHGRRNAFQGLFIVAIEGNISPAGA